jgi:hypothetical protein
LELPILPLEIKEKGKIFPKRNLFSKKDNKCEIEKNVISKGIADPSFIRRPMKVSILSYRLNFLSF